jgi:kexin
MTIKHWGENPVGNWTIKVSKPEESKIDGFFLGWNMVLWGSAIDASKAKKFWPPVVDDVLPPSDVPSRPVINDTDLPAATTTYSKPTDHLPPDHGSAISPNPGGKNPVDDSPSDAWYSHMATLVSAQKWFFAGLGFASIFLVAALVYFWRRRMSRKRLADYTSLAANDIHMNPVGQNRVPSEGRPRTAIAATAAAAGEYDDDEFEGTSTETLAARSEAVVVPSAVGLGFHSGFLDDDEPSAALSPKYRDEPESAIPRTVRTPRSGSDES